MKTILPAIHQKTRLVKGSLLLGSLFSLFSLFLLVAPTFAIETQTFSAYPTHSSDTDPRSQSWFIYSVPAGESRDDSVTIVNNGTESMTVKVYPVDSTATSNGSFALANEDATRKDVGKWVSLSTSEVTLGPKEHKIIPFTMTIPAAAVKGEHSGGIVFQATTPKKYISKGMNINVISRIGVRIYETVPGLEQLNLEVRDLHYSVVDNYLSFTFTVENKGTVYISPKGVLEVKDMFGNVVDREPLDHLVDTIVPGKPLMLKVPTHVLSPLLGWDRVNVALYYSPTKVAYASLTFMPNILAAFGVIFVILLIVAVFLSKGLLVRTNAKTHKSTLAPHIQLLAGGILLGIIAFSGLIAFLLKFFFGGV